MICPAILHTWAGYLICTRGPHAEDEPHRDDVAGLDWTPDGKLAPIVEAQAGAA